MIETVNDAVAALGGTGKAAKIFGVLPSAVSNWKAAGKFPARLHYRISREFERRKLRLAESLLDSDAA